MKRNRLGYTSVLATAATLVLVAGGCAGTGPSETSAGSDTGPSASSAGPQSGSGSDSGGSDSGTANPKHETNEHQTKKKNVIAWVLGLGVNAPSGPDNDYWTTYQELSGRDCKAAAAFPGDTAYVVRAAARACLAATGESESPDEDWEAAATVRASTDSGSLRCLDAAAFTLLASLVDAHGADPELPFELTPNDNTIAPLTCPTITEAQPAHGAAGDTIVVRGTHLADVTEVGIRDQNDEVTPAMLGAHTDSQLELTLPALTSDAGGSVSILVSSPESQWPAATAFDYRAGG